MNMLADEFIENAFQIIHDRIEHELFLSVKHHYPVLMTGRLMDEQIANDDKAMSIKHSIHNCIIKDLA